MKGVPGVMALLSHGFLFFSSSLRVFPIALRARGHVILMNLDEPVRYAPSQRAMDSFRASSFSLASWAERKRRERCWFIFARGATPSTTLSFRGRTIFTTRSV
ncbi:hypothetical protein GY45DRAFT_481708 [Cubamyces sp. BRFM 1775]|nr:hypothetical protein GY45DRAFT_481708 [Cubamyces sp. BRFM 1775]